MIVVTLHHVTDMSSIPTPVRHPQRKQLPPDFPVRIQLRVDVDVHPAIEDIAQVLPREVPHAVGAVAVERDALDHRAVHAP